MKNCLTVGVRNSNKIPCVYAYITIAQLLRTHIFFLGIFEGILSTVE